MKCTKFKNYLLAAQFSKVNVLTIYHLYSSITCNYSPYNITIDMFNTNHSNNYNNLSYTEFYRLEVNLIALNFK